MYAASKLPSLEGSRKEYASTTHRHALRSLENGGTRTVKTLRCVCDVGDTEVACEDDKEWEEVRPWTGSAVREQDLKQCKDGIERMLGDVGPSWKRASRMSNDMAGGSPIERTGVGCGKCCRRSEERPKYGCDNEG